MRSTLNMTIIKEVKFVNKMFLFYIYSATSVSIKSFVLFSASPCPCFVDIYLGLFVLAASVMFEKALRSDTAEMQWRCFAACLNALMLTPPEEAWLLRPNLSASSNQVSFI